MKKEYTLVTDTREKRPLLFKEHLEVLDRGKPIFQAAAAVARILRVSQKLEQGDYLLRGYENCTIVERKGSLREVAINCLHRSDRERFKACLGRMAQAAREPVVFLEGKPHELQDFRDPNLGVSGAIALDALLDLLGEYGIGLLVAPTATQRDRWAAGELVLRKLISGALRLDAAKLQLPVPDPTCGGSRD